MIYIVKALLALWTKRIHFFLPVIFVPAAVMAFVYGYQPFHTAQTLISVDADKASTTLLRNLERKESVDILQRRLFDNQLLEDTIKQSGLSLSFTTQSQTERNAFLDDFKNRIALNVLNDNLIQLTYKANTKDEAVKTLEQLSRNFVNEIVAPERFKTEEALMQLGEQIIHYTQEEKQATATLNKLNSKGDTSRDALKELARLEFEAQKAASQRALAQEAYEVALAQSRQLMAVRNGVETDALLTLEDSPMIVASTFNNVTKEELLKTALLVGLILGLMSVMLSHWLDNTLRTSDEIYAELGLRILGRVPNLGSVQLEEGTLSSTLNPNKKA